MARSALNLAEPSCGFYVPESRFGTWFVHTGTWSKYVLEKALGDLERLIANRRPSYPAIAI